MKTSIARSLLDSLTSAGDLVVDPFCGSGVVALEAAATGRRVWCGDWNSYAVVLTRAKLFALRTVDLALKQFERIWKRSLTLRKDQDLRGVPAWVRSFFHSETLRDALALRDACVASASYFLLGCLLGVLHHERPGFLSYPSSHLVPYLRDRKYPRTLFPCLYQRRDVRERMIAKIGRAYRRIPEGMSDTNRVFQVDARKFPKTGSIQAIITSPPYMNELDYVRDNRLRLWFVNRALPSAIDTPRRDRENGFRGLVKEVCCRLAPSIACGGYWALVLGEVSRSGSACHTATIVESMFRTQQEMKCFRLVEVLHDQIPDVRRSRRECRGTKDETVLIYEKTKLSS